MILSFDIDGTLAGQNNRAFMQACNQVLKLGLSEEDLAQLPYRQFLALPQVARQPEKVLAWMYYHPLALESGESDQGCGVSGEMREPPSLPNSLIGRNIAFC